MTRITISMAALAAFAAAAPAAAQYGAQYDNRYGGYASSDIDIAGLGAEIEAGVSRGDISGQEAYTLRSQLRGLVNLQNQYARGGLSWSERNDLQQRALGLRNEIAQAGGYAAGYGDERYRNGRYDNRYAPNGGYANGYNGYGNAYGGYSAGRTPYNNGTYGNAYGTYRGGTYNPGYSDRGYAGGQYSQYGRDQVYRDDREDDADDRYGEEAGVELRVGDRATGDLYGVPDEYRARFRDGAGFYYRYGGGNVYQIDARNGTVTRVIRVDR